MNADCPECHGNGVRAEWRGFKRVTGIFRDAAFLCIPPSVWSDSCSFSVAFSATSARAGRV
jgi:hypothetical protein